MSAPSRLAKWREARGWSYGRAARHFRVSTTFYRSLEAGTAECAPSLALEIAQKTHMTVMPGDLPGCAIEAASPSGDCRSVASGAAADDPVVAPTASAPAPELAPPATGAERGEAALPAASPHPGFHIYLLTDGNGDYAVALDPADTDFHARRRLLTPRHAAELGMELIRAALLASKPGSVPA